MNARFILSFVPALLIAGQIRLSGQGLYNEYKVKNYPVTEEFTFKEFDNAGEHDKVRKEAVQYSSMKKAPFHVENALYINPSSQFTFIDSLIRKKKVSLSSLRYYIDTASCKLIPPDYSREVLRSFLIMKSRLPYVQLYKPFYILNAEVSNEEYREFVRWVVDSTARTILARSGIKEESEFGENIDGNLILKYKKKIDWDAYRAELSLLYVPENERYYRRREIDARKINYSYSLNENISGVTNIYPDTLRWMLDFGWNSPFEMQHKVYFWHPAFKNYPVVGLTYMQIKAFLLWKTRKLQAELDKKNIPYLVEFDLPTEPELEMTGLVKLAERLEGKKEKMEARSVPSDYDLVLNMQTKEFYSLRSTVKVSEHNDLLQNARSKLELYGWKIFPALPMQPHIKGDKKYKLYQEFVYEKDFPVFINSNVSEWMSESLYASDSSLYKVNGKNKSWSRNLNLYTHFFPVQGNLENYFSIKARYTDTSKTRLFGELAKGFISPAANGRDPCKLVYGANWFDPGDMMSGVVKRNFSSIDSSYSTVGFRYVIRFNPK